MTRALLLLPLLVALPPQDSRYRIADLRAPARVDYLVVAAEKLAGGCDALLAHREAAGLKAALVTFEEAGRGDKDGPGHDALVRFLKRVHGPWGLKYVLLVGDARGEPGFTIPMKVEPSRYVNEKRGTDKDLATDYDCSSLGGEEPVLHVGRFPADSPADLAAMIDRTIAYETAIDPGPWQRKMAFLNGAPGLDPIPDALFEKIFASIACQRIPAGFDLEIAYAKPSSPYCPHPPSFNDNAIRMYNEGPIFYVYTGHGSRDGCDTITWRKQSHAILEAKDAKRLAPQQGRPVMVVLACSTGHADARSGDCLGEELLRAPGGPVAFLGGSRVTTPYGNALLGLVLPSALFDPAQATLGEALDAARRWVLEPGDDALRLSIDRLAGLMTLGEGKAPLLGMRQDVIRHYNLLGDPALRLRRPRSDLVVEIAGGSADEGRLKVSGRAPFAEGRARISFECERDRFTAPPPALPAEDSPDFEAQASDRYRRANEKALLREEVLVTGGSFQADLDFGSRPPKGRYVIKAFAWNGRASAWGVATAEVAGAPAK